MAQTRGNAKKWKHYQGRRDKHVCWLRKIIHRIYKYVIEIWIHVRWSPGPIWGSSEEDRTIAGRYATKPFRPISSWNLGRELEKNGNPKVVQLEVIKPAQTARASPILFGSKKRHAPTLCWLRTTQRSNRAQLLFHSTYGRSNRCETRRFSRHWTLTADPDKSWWAKVIEKNCVCVTFRTIPVSSYAIWIGNRTRYISACNGRHFLHIPLVVCVSLLCRICGIFKNPRATYQTPETRLDATMWGCHHYQIEKVEVLLLQYQLPGSY